ncbi:hypothetical protein JVT61DRAFT_5696 [Boletus reticuloceps]|uniref:RecA family profile 1 domain-containing protein n=1 Tax=Boletus reticuloceps TaxID=495285 RepID=A0A8I3AG96_9AGAM|nr:hypothetical protein JVT61DRAFT_5696 [Boletus reticuloceps]
MDVPVESLETAPSPLTPIPVLPAFNRGDVIEIQGPASSGKTHLLYHILLSFLVPVSPPHAEIAVVVYDTDATFDIERFRRLLLSRISRHPCSTLDPQESVRRALARLHLFRPTTLVQLAASIANLAAYHSSHMTHQEIAVLAIDSISPFYWADRFSAEQLRDAASAKNKRVPMALSPLRHVLDAIQSVRRSHRPLTILTNWALHSAPSHSASLYKQHLHLFPVVEDGIADLGAKASSNTDHSSSSPFRLAHHISLSSPTSDQFAASPLDIALLRDPRHRQGIVDNGRVQCLTRSSGTRNIVRFTLQITDDDILVHAPEPPIP